MGYRPVGRDTCGLREEIKKLLLQTGAVAVGFSRAEEVTEEVKEIFCEWIEAGKHAGMDYMSRNKEIRFDPRKLLEGTKTVISLAFSYHTDVTRNPALPQISSYAFLPDYHKWIKKLIRKSSIGELLGEEHRDWRICVDSAPILERYWARKSGIGLIGRNGALIIPGIGAEVFLAEILCSTELEPDESLKDGCGNCEACINACPTGAMTENQTIDCNRCISYLTIEHRGEWTDSRQREAMSTEAARHTIFGCDRCISVCRHNTTKKRAVVEPLPDVIEYTAGDAPAGSCLKRGTMFQ